MPLPFEVLARDVQAGRVAPAYILAGPDGFQQSEVLAALRATVAEFGHERLDGSLVAPKDVVGALRSVSLVPGRLVVVDDAPWIVASKRGEAGEGRAEGKAGAVPEQALLDYLDQPARGAALVLRAAALPDKRRRLVKRVVERGVVLECVPPRDNGPWLRERCRALGLRLTPEVFALVASRLHGADCGRMNAELRKLAACGAEIPPDVLEALLPPGQEERIYELVDAAVAGRAAEACALAAALRAQGEPVPRLLYSLGMHLRALVQVSAACRGGMRPETVAPGLGLHPFVARKAWDQARRLDDATVAAALEAVWEAEFGFKTGRLEEGMALDLALLRVVLAVRTAGLPPVYGESGCR